MSRRPTSENDRWRSPGPDPYALDYDEPENGDGRATQETPSIRQPRVRPSEDATNHRKPAKRKKESGGQKRAHSADRDVGLSYAFPEMDGADTDIAAKGPPMNAAEYISQVRTEAQLRPSFVVAPRSKSSVSASTSIEIRDGQNDDTISKSESDSSAIPERYSASHVIDEHWQEALLMKFGQLRNSINNCTPSEPVGRLSQNNWGMLFANPPSLPNVKAMDLRSVLLGIESLTKRLSRNIQSNLAIWVLVLLARLPQILVGGDMAILRQLGKRSRDIRRSSPGSLNATTRCTLDSIVTILAVPFGQSDLLD